MIKQQKIDRIKRDGWIVTDFPFRTMRFEALKRGVEVKTKNIYNLHKQIYGY